MKLQAESVKPGGRARVQTGESAKPRGRAMSVLACFAAVVRTNFASRMAYRGDFALGLVMMLAGDLIVPLITLLVYRSGASFPGWAFHEAILIQAVFTLAKGVAFPFFFGIIWSTLDRVREGTFDLMLIKPRSPLFMSMINGFDAEDFGRLLSGGLLLGYALAIMPDKPGGLAWLQFALLFLFALLVLFAVSLFMSGLLFKWVGSSRVYDIFDAVTMFGQYPGTLFSKSFLNVILYAVPVAMLGFVPASALLGRLDGSAWISAAVCVALAGASWAYWQAMLRQYTSAGG
jgi:ABC-2 type transport system permease protein